MRKILGLKIPIPQSRFEIFPKNDPGAKRISESSIISWTPLPPKSLRDSRENRPRDETVAFSRFHGLEFFSFLIKLDAEMRSRSYWLVHQHVRLKHPHRWTGVETRFKVARHKKGEMGNVPTPKERASFNRDCCFFTFIVHMRGYDIVHKIRRLGLGPLFLGALCWFIFVFLFLNEQQSSNSSVILILASTWLLLPCFCFKRPKIALSLLLSLLEALCHFHPTSHQFKIHSPVPRNGGKAQQQKFDDFRGPEL